MKKQVLSILTIALAVVGSAFTRPAERNLQNQYVYEFDPLADPTDQGEVEEKSNWIYVDDDGGLCDALESDQPCRILVDEAHHSGTTLNDAPASAITITANNDVNPAYFRVLSATDMSVNFNATVSNQEPD